MDETSRRPLLEQVFGLKHDRMVVVYANKTGFDVWVYAWDPKVVKSHGGGQPAGPVGLGRCLALRYWGSLPERGDVWDIRYEMGDLDLPTTQAMGALIRSEFPAPKMFPKVTR